jgi:hypothetical protein
MDAAVTGGKIIVGKLQTANRVSGPPFVPPPAGSSASSAVPLAHEMV